jgi:hypothetical protein
MRGRLYPQPRQRYERFRLNPYSPLYQNLAFFVSVPPVAGILPELHGPYALSGTSCFVYSRPDIVTIRFFPEIGRAAIASIYNTTTTPQWSIALPHQNVITLTVTAIVNGPMSNKIFLGLVDMGANPSAVIAEYQGYNYPMYYWRNTDRVRGSAYSEGKFWPLSAWFTYSATFRPGSVYGYLSNWGIIDAQLLSGVWPDTIIGPTRLWFAACGPGTFVADGFVHLRELSLTELHAISDLSNVDYRMPGEAPLILPVRTYWPSVLPIAPSYLKRRSLGARSGTREAAL